MRTFSFGSDEIRFDFTLEGETIRLGGTPLTVLDHLTIRGPGFEGIAVSGNQASTVLVVEANRSLTIDNLTIRDAVDSGIVNRGSLSVSDSLITNNIGSAGGGIFNSGSLSLTDTTVANNSANSGGGIYSSGSATAIRSTVTENGVSKESVIVLAEGGGVHVGGGTFSFIESTISNNAMTTDGWGAGIMVSASGSLQMSAIHCLRQHQDGDWGYGESRRHRDAWDRNVERQYHLGK